MTNTKIKPELNGVAETMLLTFYARAKYSKSPKHAFYDAKAVELVERLFQGFQGRCHGQRHDCQNHCI